MTDKAQVLHDLHVAGRPLALANAWDVASARIVEDAGASAIATTSAGAAWSFGAADGVRFDRDRAIDLVARVVAAVRVPVTADIESGYGRTPDDVAETVRRILEAGAVGINLEDARYDEGPALRSINDQCERIAAARGAAEAAGVRLFLNARTDPYLRAVGEPADRLRDTLDRAAAYVAAGADGIFVPGVTDPAIVAELAGKITVPLNILAGPGAPTVGELARLGVARVSLGSSVAAAAYGLVRRSATALLADGNYPELDGGIAYAQLNDLLAERKN